jgi:hypothetical protein
LPTLSRFIPCFLISLSVCCYLCLLVRMIRACVLQEPWMYYVFPGSCTFCYMFYCVLLGWISGVAEAANTDSTYIFSVYVCSFVA